MKKLEKITSDLFSKSTLTNEQMKNIYGGDGTTEEVLPPDDGTLSTICQGKAGSTSPGSGNHADNDPCSDD